MTLDTAVFPHTSLPLGLRMQFLWKRILQLTAFSAKEGLDSVYALEKEFKALIASEGAAISKICFSYSCSVAEFDDLRQDALINIWRGMRNFRGEASQRTWIYRVTVNSCLSTIRKQSRHQHESIEGLYGMIETDNSDKEAIEQIHRIIGTLGCQEKAIIIMWLDDLSYDEIASAMGMNRNTVATKIRRIKDKIAKEYKKEEKL
ncbi:MAG: sigma-70 family RNA polymerase sigma factor [Muribaculum sp.]|nr:sigma-70 family RNA polymerase sigma factor [Muribaculum sp.]